MCNLLKTKLISEAFGVAESSDFIEVYIDQEGIYAILINEKYDLQIIALYNYDP